MPNRLIPDRLCLLRRYSIGWDVGVYPESKEDLGSIHVSQTSDDRLIEQRCADRNVPPPESIDDVFDRLVTARIAKRIRSEPADDLIEVDFVDELARRWACEIQGPRCTSQRQPSARCGWRRTLVKVTELSEQAEMNMKDWPMTPPIEEMLSPGFDRIECVTIENSRAVLEPALG